MIKHKIFIGFIASALAVLIVLFAYSRQSVQTQSRSSMLAKKEIARRLALTDLALWTEARYARHPSQADLFTPFQEFPSSLEHFPAGSIVTPPGQGGVGRRRLSLRTGSLL
jgi:hypothetical protein